MSEAKDHHHVATRLTPARYEALERIRARNGLRSLNATVAFLIDEDEAEHGADGDRKALRAEDR